jgi:hypothetical protein
VVALHWSISEQERRTELFQARFTNLWVRGCGSARLSFEAMACAAREGSTSVVLPRKTFSQMWNEKKAEVQQVSKFLIYFS